MALISINVTTNDVHDEKLNRGHYEVKMFAGLDEAPEAVFQEGLKRINSALMSIPPEKHYSRLHPA